MNKFVKILLLVTAILLMQACGGGGSGGAPENSNNNSSSSSSSSGGSSGDDGSRKTAQNSYVESGGLVVMEIENTSAPLDLWIKKTDNPGYRGSGHFEFTGNNQSSGPATSPLSFTFKIIDGGLYRLALRSRKRLDGAEPDKSNDAYARVEGDYGADPNAGDNHNNPAQLWDLQRDVKLFGGPANGWGFTSTLDLGGHQNKRKPHYDFVSGQSYTLTISGRSKNFNIDRIIFHKLSMYSKDDLDQTNAMPETVADGGIDPPGANRQPTYACPTFTTTPLWQGNGRIAISADGNEHDKDDWAATAMTLGILASQKLQDQLALYIHSDHHWGSNHDHANAGNEMIESAENGKIQFNFDNSIFVSAVAPGGLAEAVSKLATEINNSSAADPLFILGAGPMDVIGQAIAMADSTKLQFVTLISHSNWNNRHADNPSAWETHSGWTMAEINTSFAVHGLTIDQIADQNGEAGYDGLRANQFKFAWLQDDTHPAYTPAWAWLYGRLQAAKKQSDFDPSDAGMAVYLLTGNDQTDPCHARALMENPK